MTDVVEIIEGEVAQKELQSAASRVRPRPPAHSRIPARNNSHQSKLKPVTERDESDDIEDLSASVRSFDGIDTDALKRLSAMSIMSTIDDSDRSIFSASSSSSSGKRSGSLNAKHVPEQFQSMDSLGGSNERYSLSSNDISYNSQFDSFSCSISSHAFSKSSQSTLGISGDIIESMGDLGQLLEPPTNIYQAQGTNRGPRVSGGSGNGSTATLPSLSEFSAMGSTSSMPSLADYSMDRSGHSSIMPGLGGIVEEDVSAGSFSSFNTGASFSTAATEEVGVIIGGRSVAEILKEQEHIAGRNLDVLEPTIRPKKPQMQQRWSSDERESSTGNAEIIDDAPPAVASRQESDTSSVYENSDHVQDLPPRMAQRRTSNSLSSRGLSQTPPSSLSSEGLSQTPALSPVGPPRKSVSGRTKRTMLPGIGGDTRVSDTSFRLSSIPLPTGFGELSEHSPVPNVAAPRMVLRQDTASSSVSTIGGLSQIPTLSPHNHSEGRKIVVPAQAESIETVQEVVPTNGRRAGKFAGGSEMDSPPAVAMRRISDELDGPLVDAPAGMVFL
ncbi:unnamed protein product [Cylindrotheca closterium]|uniref:Uncharacterized protein n=1 Tax=Cylindrotheca closterium TaxID=2856 RepID=A0AAD2G8S9_9STRA|nr:unnamed protein product [Cylindrotheca closterium]